MGVLSGELVGIRRLYLRSQVIMAISPCGLAQVAGIGAGQGRVVLL